MEEINKYTAPLDGDKSNKSRINKVNKRDTSIEDGISSDTNLICCLRKEIVKVKYIPRQSGMVSNPKHVFYGGMSETALRYYTVPLLENGQYCNILTNDEKSYLEEIMGLEYNSLSIYKKNDNYWENFMVRLTKDDNILDLSNPNDYIKYKVLIANKEYIAESLDTLQNYPKASYQFVIEGENSQSKKSKLDMNITMEAYMKLGEIKEDSDILRVIIETLEGKPLASSTGIEFLQVQCNKLIQSNPSLFVRTAGDELLSTKVLIKKSIEAGLISKRGDYYYLKQDNTPLCNTNENPTFTVAAKYLNYPKNQELKFSLEARLK